MHKTTMPLNDTISDGIHTTVLLFPNKELQNLADQGLVRHECIWNEETQTSLLRVWVNGISCDLDWLSWGTAERDNGFIDRSRALIERDGYWETMYPTEPEEPKWTDCPTCGAPEAINPNGVEPECLRCTYIGEVVY